MKIVFLAPFGIRPKGTVIARMLPLAVELQRRGHRVTIIAPPYTNPEDSGKVETIQGVTLRNILLEPYHKALSAPLLAWRMYRATMEEQPDLIHLYKPKGYGGLAAILHLALEKIGLRLAPLILDSDDWEGAGGMNELHPYSPLEQRFYHFQEQWLIRRAAGVTVASRALESLVLGMGVPPQRLLYLPNCVAESIAGDGNGIRKQLGIDVKEPVVLLYTRFFEFSQEKLHFLFEEIHRKEPAARFLVVGKGRRGEEDILVDAAREKGFPEALIMAGWVDPCRLPDYFAAADLAIYPLADTLVNRCKCPAKLTELLLAGLPVVADRVGQALEYIKPECSGILCDHANWQEMADAVVALLQDPNRRNLLGRKGRSYLLENFSWQAFAHHLDKFYGSNVTDDKT